MKIKRRREDIAFSKLIRWRDGWRCQRCGRRYVPNSGGLQNAHVIHSRRKERTRFCEINCHSLCSGCHMYLDGAPREKERWARDKLGDEPYDWCVREGNKTGSKMKKWEVKEFVKYCELRIGQYEKEWKW